MLKTILELWPIAAGVIIYLVFAGIANYLKKRIGLDEEPIGNIPKGGTDED